MDNTVIPFTESDTEESSSEDGDLLSNNLGVYHNDYDETEKRFMNMESTHKYQEKRNKLFTPQLSKLRLLIDSKNIDHSIEHKTSNYTIYFDGIDSPNETSGFNSYKNVIGFKFIKSILSNSTYQINDNNNTFLIQLTDNTTEPILKTLNKGSYTLEGLRDELIRSLNENSTPSNKFNVIINENRFNYTIRTTDNTNFSILWEQSSGYLHRLIGVLNINTPFLNEHIATNVAQHNVHFVDLVIPEIPHIACKKNSVGKNVIERIPLGKSGSVTEYTNDINLDNYFFPINLSKINIQLYEDSTDLFYDCQNVDNSFEFELTIMNY